MPYGNYGSSSSYVNPYAAQQFAPVMQGMSAMNNLGNQISSGFALANALSSANLQARAPYDASMQIEQMRQQGQNQRLASILPALLSAFGGGGGSGGFSTNYGASASYGTPQQQQAPQAPVRQDGALGTVFDMQSQKFRRFRSPTT